MAIRLEKGQRINLEKDNGSKLSQFCVGCNWGAIEKWVVKSCGFLGLSKKEVREVVDVDLDLSCLMFDAEGKPIDHIWSPLFRFGDRNVGLPNGKLDSLDRALHHTGDDLTGDQDGDDGLDNEIITVDLACVNPAVQSIVFFLNIYNNNEYQGETSPGFLMRQSVCTRGPLPVLGLYSRNMMSLQRQTALVCADS